MKKQLFYVASTGVRSELLLAKFRLADDIRDAEKNLARLKQRYSEITDVIEGMHEKMLPTSTLKKHQSNPTPK